MVNVNISDDTQELFFMFSEKRNSFFNSWWQEESWAFPASASFSDAR